MLELKNLTKQYGNKKALNNVSLNFSEGIYGLLGPNGAGKSTMMNIITGNIKPSSGKVMWNNKEITSLGPSYRSLLGYAPQQQGLYDTFSGRRFLSYMAALKDISKKSMKDEIERVLSYVNLTDSADKPIGTYSGGMKQRAIIAMALACKAEVLIADEPTTALDVTIQAQIMNLLREIKNNGTSILLITHDLALVRENSDEIAVMYAGRIVEHASNEEFFKNPNHPYSQALLKSIPSNRDETLETIQGQPPTLSQKIDGCKFNPRCKHCMGVCKQLVPPLKNITENHQSACFLNN